MLLTGRVVHVECLAEATLLYDDADTGDELLVVKLHGTQPQSSGTSVRLAADVRHVHLFDASGEALGHADPRWPVRSNRVRAGVRADSPEGKRVTARRRTREQDVRPFIGCATWFPIRSLQDSAS